MVFLAKRISVKVVEVLVYGGTGIGTGTFNVR